MSPPVDSESRSILPQPRTLRLGLLWIAMALALGGALGYDALASRPPNSINQRVLAIASEVRCPSCLDETAAQSTTQTAIAVRATIRQRLLAGQDQEQIEAYLESRYGPAILLRPQATGVSALVWVLPVVAALAAIAALAAVLFNRRAGPAVPLNSEERELLEKARRRWREHGGQ